MKYFRQKKWADITREERYFCAHLYFKIRGREKEFIEWLVDEVKIKCLTDADKNEDWEAGYEVCFYRDYIKRLGDENGNTQIKKSATKYSEKRTFDICLFSNKKIIIIEAKSFEIFESSQLEEFRKDAQQMASLLQEYPDVELYLIPLVSSIYWNNLKKPRPRSIYPIIESIFGDTAVTWAKLYESKFTDEVFLNADNSYPRNAL